MDVTSPGTSNGRPLAPSPLTSPVPQYGAGADANTVVDHLINLLEVTLGASLEDLEAPGSLLSKAKKADTVSRCQRFGAENQAVLYVQKDLISTEETNGVNGSSGLY